MDEDLRAKMEELNDERLLIRQLKRLPLILVAVPFIGFGLSELFPNMSGIVNILFYVPFISIPICLFAVTPKVKRFEAKYKEQIIKGIFPKYLDEFEYSPNSGIARSYINNLNVITTGDIYNSEDRIDGKIDGVNFVRADIHIEDESTDSEGHTSRTTIFEGQWMVFDFPKKFKSEVQVCSKHFSGTYTKSGIFSKIFSSSEELRHQVETESAEFNKKFKVFASDDHTTFYLLTPQIIEAIVQLQEKFGCKIMLFFSNNSLNVALRTGKDSLEPSYKKDMEKAFEETVKGTENEMQTLVDFVKYLKLNNDLFVKEV